MAGYRILLCDRDRRYTEALVQYLLGSRYGDRLEVSFSTNPESFQEQTGEYEVGLLGEEFLYTEDGRDRPRKCRFERMLRLSEEKADAAEDETVFYKYQSMDVLMERILQLPLREKASAAHIVTAGQQEWISVFSPICHELRLPFALSLCRALAEKKEVLFMDLEQTSILYRLMEAEERGDLLDYFYLQEHAQAEGRLEGFLEEYGGFSFLPPMCSPWEIAVITEAQWMCLMEDVKKSRFDTVILLFDACWQGTLPIWEASRQLLLLERREEYYRLSQERFFDLLKKRGLDGKARELYLPMSAGNLTRGAYRLEHLLAGRLGEFVKKEIARGIG